MPNVGRAAKTGTMTAIGGGSKQVLAGFHAALEQTLAALLHVVLRWPSDAMLKVKPAGLDPNLRCPSRATKEYLENKLCYVSIVQYILYIMARLSLNRAGELQMIVYAKFTRKEPWKRCQTPRGI